ncbi:unnamed protein product [Phytophthora fragariaefolia]|uniref:Unnamed protein product n=1 Tax=Phytophthora fragariaefolia TaxID=1490495 RepID=A0A9W6XJV8_9STRA|nr:unnamed protein product [Phytophthora fragariaefolia]
MDFTKNEVHYEEDCKMLIITFRTFVNRGKSNVAPVCMTRRSRFMRSTVTPMEISVAAADGEKGIFDRVRSHRSAVIGDNSRGTTKWQGMGAGDQRRWRSGQVAVEAGAGHVNPTPQGYEDTGVEWLDVEGEKQ